jgi:hypothetical protein
MKQITLSQGKIALVDDDDHERLSQFRWFYKPERNFHQGYAFRHGRKSDATKMVYLHHEIAAAPPGHEVLFLNNDHLRVWPYPMRATQRISLENGNCARLIGIRLFPTLAMLTLAVPVAFPRRLAFLVRDP